MCAFSGGRKGLSVSRVGTSTKRVLCVLLTSTAYLYHLSPISKPSIRPNQEESHDHYLSPRGKSEMLWQRAVWAGAEANHCLHLQYLSEKKKRKGKENLLDSNNLQIDRKSVV